MLANYKTQFSNQRVFRDITSERADVVKMVEGLIVKVYACKGTCIIHSKNEDLNHASISSSEGYDHIQEWEISYAIERILKVNNKDVMMYVSQNGVIHLRTNDDGAIKN